LLNKPGSVLFRIWFIPKTITSNLNRNNMKTLELNQMAEIEGNGCFFAIPKMLVACGSPITTAACSLAILEVELCWNDTE
jgi:hypothetical protein